VSKRLFVLFAFLLISILALAGCSAPVATVGSIVLEEVFPEARVDVEAAAPAQAVSATGAEIEPAAPSSSVRPSAPVTGTVAADPALADLLNALEARLEQIYAGVTPSVVNIQVVQGTGTLPLGHPDIPGSPSDPSLPEGFPPQQGGLGSGFVWDEQGHIVTNNHVVEGAERITVTFYDDTSVAGEVVGTDPHSDLAVIKVDLPPTRLLPVQVADSTQVRVGQLAVAIGNPFGLEGTMTVGFVSALGRSLPVAAGTTLGPSYTIPDIIQTDAPINPGNSGGVLVDDEGRVIGVPTAIESPVRANAGIGFAVPSAIVQKVVPVLIRDGRYEHAWLGISGTSLSAELAETMDLEAGQRGVLIIEVVNDSPADKADLRGSERQTEIEGQGVRIGGDVIVAIDSEPVHEFDDLVTYLARSTSVGDAVALTVLREGEKEVIQVTLAGRPGQENRPVQAQQDRGATVGAWLGIMGLTVTPEIAEAMDLGTDQQGVLVGEVVQSSPASDAGLRSGSETLQLNGQEIWVGGDVIVAVDEEPVGRMEDLLSILGSAEPGHEVTLTILRDGQQTELQVALGERPTTIP
jgi:S1-C subfamily serine protease